MQAGVQLELQLHGDSMKSLLVIIILSYICGSFPTSIILGKLIKNIDIRNYGSGNAGGTNAFRVLGWQWGILVSIVDILKGVIATLVISQIRIDTLPFDSVMLIRIIAGLSAIVGHTFTIFAGFKGGKGVATGAGVLISLYPFVFLLCVLIFALVLFSTGIVSVSSMVTSICFPLLVLIISYLKHQSPDTYLLTFSILIPIFIIFTHRTNIQKMLKGEEHVFDKIAIFKKKK